MKSGSSVLTCVVIIFVKWENLITKNTQWSSAIWFLLATRFVLDNIYTFLISLLGLACLLLFYGFSHYTPSHFTHYASVVCLHSVEKLLLRFLSVLQLLNLTWTSYNVCTGCQPNACEIGSVFSKSRSCVGLLQKLHSYLVPFPQHFLFSGTHVEGGFDPGGKFSIYDWVRVVAVRFTWSHCPSSNGYLLRLEKLCKHRWYCAFCVFFPPTQSNAHFETAVA